MIAESHYLPKQFVVIRHNDQSFLGWIFGIEQTHVAMVGRKPEIVEQHAIVEQQLDVMFFPLETAVSIGNALFNIPVLTRFLFHQQAHVSRHQIDTPLYSELFTDERRLENRILAVVSALFKQNMDCLSEMGCHKGGIVLELRGIKILARTEIKGFLSEILLQRQTHVSLFAVDDIVQRSIGKVTQKDGLGHLSRKHPVKKMKQRMAPIASETTGYGTDVYEKIGLYHNQRILHNQDAVVADRLFQRGTRRKQEVQLHAFRQHVAQIGTVSITDSQRLLAVGGNDELFVPRLHNTADGRTQRRFCRPRTPPPCRCCLHSP